MKIFASVLSIVVVVSYLAFLASQNRSSIQSFHAVNLSGQIVDVKIDVSVQALFSVDSRCLGKKGFQRYQETMLRFSRQYPEIEIFILERAEGFIEDLASQHADLSRQIGRNYKVFMDPFFNLTEKLFGAKDVWEAKGFVASEKNKKFRGLLNTNRFEQERVCSPVRLSEETVLVSAKRYYARNCKSCHLGLERAGAVGFDLDQLILSQEGRQKIVRQVTLGQMPPWGIEVYNPYVKAGNKQAAQGFVEVMKNRALHNRFLKLDIAKQDIDTWKTIAELESDVRIDSEDQKTHFFPLGRIDQTLKINEIQLIVPPKLMFNYVSVRVSPVPLKDFSTEKEKISRYILQPPESLGVIASWLHNQDGYRRFSQGQFIELIAGQHLILEVGTESFRKEVSRGNVKVKLGHRGDDLSFKLNFHRFEANQEEVRRYSEKATIEAEYEVREDIALVTVKPNLGALTGQVRLGFVTPDGERRTILSMSNFRSEFQRGFALKKPLRLKKGSRLWIRARDLKLSKSSTQAHRAEVATQKSLEDVKMLRFSYKYFHDGVDAR